MGWKDGITRDKERMDSCGLRPGKTAQAGKRQIPNAGFSTVLRDTPGLVLGLVPVPEEREGSSGQRHSPRRLSQSNNNNNRNNTIELP